MRNPSQSERVGPTWLRRLVGIILLVFITIFLVIMAYVLYQQSEADRAAEKGVTGDGQVSETEWRRFVTGQISLINQGKELSEEVHELFCKSKLPIEIDPQQATQLALYCTNTTQIADR